MVNAVLGGLVGGIAGGATVSITIRAIDKFSGTFGKASTGMNILKGVATAGAASIVALGASMTALGVSSLKIAADFEQTQIAFTTMLGSGEEAQKFLKELAEFARKTPFTLTGIERSARQLLAVGFEAEDVLPVLKNVGDVASGLGLGQEGLQRLILNLGQVQAQGRLTGRELRDFAVAGIPLLDELAKQLGITTSEVQELVSAGEIETEVVIQAFRDMTSEGGRFADLMAKQAETVQGKFSNLQDGFELLRREIGAALLPIVAEFADVLLDEVLPAVEPLIPLIGELLSKSLRNVVDVVEPMIPLMIDLIREFLDLGLVMLNDVVPVVQDQLFPAIKNELVPALRDDLLPALLKLIPTMTDFFVDTIIPNLPVLIRFTALILKAVSAILELIDVLVDLFTQVKKFAGLEKKGLLSFLDFTPIGFLTKKVTGVDDFILRPDGSLLKTNPNDTIIGTQNPGGLGGSIVVNIENINGISGRDIADALEEELTNRVSLS